jgi:hypothetical protein
MQSKERRFSTAQAAEYLGIGESTLRNGMTAGSFPKPAYKVSLKTTNMHSNAIVKTNKDKYKRNQWTQSQLDDWLETQRYDEVVIK